MPVLPDRGTPATDIGFRIRIGHPLGAWSVLMRTITTDPPTQQTGRNAVTLSWETGWYEAYRPNGGGLAYGDFDPDSTGRWLIQLGMPYLNYAAVGGTILMFRDTTAGAEQILFWLANHGSPVASNPYYAPQWFSLCWQESLNSWLFVARSYRNQRPAGSDQSGPYSMTIAHYPNAGLMSGLGIGMQNQANTFYTDPYLIHLSTTNMRDWGVLIPGGVGVRLHYPAGMVAGSMTTTATAGLPFHGNRLNVPGFPTLHQLGTFSTINTSLTSDDFLFFYLPEGHTVPSGWLSAADAFPWGAPVSFGCRLHVLPRAERIAQASFYTPDGETVFWPQMVSAAEGAGHPFYERFAPDLIGGGNGGGGSGGGGGSSRPGAGVLWPRRA
jgi:hypothetical protein